MMKKAIEGSNYILSFLGVELLIFFSIYVLHALIFKSFSLPDAAIRGLYEIFWRIISLQIIIQAVFMYFAVKAGFVRELMVFVSALVAYAVACVISFSDMAAIWNLMRLPTKEAVGEGFAITVSVITTLVLFRILGLSK